jgi:hypothetical protein
LSWGWVSSCEGVVGFGELILLVLTNVAFTDNCVIGWCAEPCNKSVEVWDKETQGCLILHCLIKVNLRPSLGLIFSCTQETVSESQATSALAKPSGRSSSRVSIGVGIILRYAPEGRICSTSKTPVVRFCSDSSLTEHYLSPSNALLFS